MYEESLPPLVRISLGQIAIRQLDNHDPVCLQVGLLDEAVPMLSTF